MNLLSKGHDKLNDGIQRLGQKFLLELLTEQGSMLFLPNRGCSFLTRLLKKAKTEFDVIVSFAASKKQLKRNLISDETIFTQADERYVDSTIDKIIMEDGGLIFDFIVSSRAGTAIRMTTPYICLKDDVHDKTI